MPEITTRTIQEMKEVAYFIANQGKMTQQAAYKPDGTPMAGNDAAYWVIRDPGQNITIIPPYRLGSGEYPKTYGHFHDPAHEETYQILFGKAGLLLQWVENDKVSKIEFKILNAGEKFTVTAGPGHALINLGSSYLITLDDHDPSKMANVYEKVKENHGLGYFICDSKKGISADRKQYITDEIVAIPNPAFESLPPLQKNA